MIKIAFFGTPEFAGRILSWILEYSGIDCKLVVSQPDKVVGRKRELIPTPVKQVALENNIEVMQPEKLRKNEDFFQTLKDLNLDFIVVVAYGKIIPKEILDIPKYGCVNIHGSILPKYRGASPVQAAVKAGERETWLTTMYMSEGMDEWDILQIGKIKVDIVDTSEDIFGKFIEIGPKLLVDTLKKVKNWELQGAPQDASAATYCGKINREDGEVFFREQSSDEIYNTFRAYTPWPWVFTFYEGKRFVLEKIKLYTTPSSQPSPLEEKERATRNTQPSSPFKGEEIQRWGRVWEFVKMWKNRYGIVCNDKNILEVSRVKLEGKKSMDVASFVNGNKEVMWYIFD